MWGVFEIENLKEEIQRVLKKGGKKIRNKEVYAIY